MGMFIIRALAVTAIVCIAMFIGVLVGKVVAISYNNVDIRR